MRGPWELRAGLLQMRSAAVVRLLSGRRPPAPLANVLQALFVRSVELARRVRVLEDDPAAELILCAVPYDPRPLWVPARSAEEAEIALYLRTLDCYHFAYVGDLVRSGAVVLDCGGYAGEFALWALDRGADHVFVLEPSPRNAEAARRNLSRHTGAGRATIDVRAVWQHSGEVHLSTAGPANTQGVREMDNESARLYTDSPEAGAEDGGPTDATRSPIAANHDPGATLRVAAVSVDELVREASISKLDFIKMDIEGAERHAVRGASATLATQGPALAVCTYHLPDDLQVISDRIAEANPLYRGAVVRSRYPVYVASRLPV